MRPNIVTIIISVALFFTAVLASDSHAKETIDIGILADVLNDDFAPRVQQLQDEIRAVVGQSAELRFAAKNGLLNNFDLQLAEKNYRTLLQNEVDVILAFGPTNNELLTKQASFRKPTILFGAINSDVLSVNLKKETSGVSNFTYIVSKQSYKEDLIRFRTIYPFQRVGVVAAHEAWKSKEVSTAIAETFKQLGADYKFIDFKNPDQFERDILDVDAVYLAEGFGISYADMDAMAEVMIEKKLPSFTSSDDRGVEGGWLATNRSNSNIERLFRRIALGVEAVVNGENLSERPLYIEFSETVSINYNTAERVGVPIRLSQIANTDLVGDFDEILVDETYTLIEAIEQSLANNVDLKVSQYDVLLAQEDVFSAKSTYYPDVSVSASQSWVDPDVAQISGGQNPERQQVGRLAISQTLFSETGNAAISIQKNQLNAQRETHNATFLDTVLNTSRACFDLLRLKNALVSQAENLQITKRNLKVAEQNFETGQASKADIYRFRSQMASNLQAVIDAINSYEQGQYALNRILNRPIDTRIDIAKINLRSNEFEPEQFDFERLKNTLDSPLKQQAFEEFLVLKALEISPELGALKFNLKALDRSIKQNGWRRYLPTVSASATANRVFDRGGLGLPDPNFALDDDYSVGLVFSIPLFNRGVDNIDLRRVKKQHRQLLLQIESVSQAIETRVRTSISSVSSQVANIELSKLSENSAQQSLELVEASYASGAVTITDLIDSQNNYLQSQLASVNAVYNFLESAITMERAVGNYVFLKSSKIDDAEFVEQYEKFLSERDENLNGVNDEN